MNFTIEDIKDNKQLINFIRQQDRKLEKIIHGKGINNIYSSEYIIEILENNIKNCKSNIAKFIPLWQSHIEYLKSKYEKEK